ncbi:MAG: type II secretion system protein, partial [Acidobacteria bacterium]|nr:type II secretion system protein [Acidobacteriota bacterium]
MKNFFLPHHSKRIKQSGMALLWVMLFITIFAVLGLALIIQTATVLKKVRLERKRIEVESFSRATMLDLRVAAQNYFVKMVAEAQEDINKTPIAGNQLPTLQQVKDRVKSMFPKYLPVSMSGGTLMHGVKADPRWQGDGWEHMKGQGTIILNLDGIELHQVNGRPTAIGFFTLTVPYTVELDW